MKLKIFFVADPIDKLNPHSDTSLCILREALERGHDAFWVDHQSIGLSHTEVVLEASKCQLFKKGGLPKLRKKESLLGNSFHVGLIRKDPPFNEDYLKLCWLLSLIEKKVFFINRPSLLLRYHEKLLPLEAYAQGYLLNQDLIPTFLGNESGAKSFLKSLKTNQVVSKPFLGHGGRGIKLQNKKVFLQSYQKNKPDLVQPFLKEVSQEDRRVIVLGGKSVAQFVRIPPPGGFIANLAQGGQAESRPLSKKQLESIERACRFLKAQGFALAGLDLIGDKISEINVTSPTGFVSIEELTGVSLAQATLKLMERNALRGKK